MQEQFNLNRFLEAQHSIYSTALQEIKNGKKRSHWMWFIFPQLKGLGFSSNSQYYGISNMEEAAAYLAHPVLGERLIEICKALATVPSNNATTIFGHPDDLKLHSCLTLFSVVNNADPIFMALLYKFFNDKPDTKTHRLLQQ